MFKYLIIIIIIIGFNSCYNDNNSNDLPPDDPNNYEIGKFGTSRFNQSKFGE